MDPMTAAGSQNAAIAARTSGDASASILRRAINTAATESEQLLDSMPKPDAGSTSATLPPIGNVGRRLDIKM